MEHPTPPTTPSSSSLDPPISQKRPRQNYTLEFKNEVVQFAELTNNCQAARKFGISRTNIQKWRQMKNELAAEIGMNQGGAKKKRLGGGGRPVKNQELDEKLEEWIQENQGKCNGKSIQEYAKMIRGDSDFKASNGWLQRFMIRHGLSTPKTPRSSKSESNQSKNQLNVDKTLEEILQLINSNGGGESFWNGVFQGENNGGIVEESVETVGNEEETGGTNISGELQKFLESMNNGVENSADDEEEDLGKKEERDRGDADEESETTTGNNNSD